MTIPPPALEYLPLELLIDYTLGGDLAVPLPTQLANLPPPDLESPWVYAHYMAMVQWLTAYQPLGDTPLEQVRGWLEAFYHTCEAEVWPVAQVIATTPLAADSPALYHQLGQWGHFREQVVLCEALLHRVEGSLAWDLRLLAGDGWRQLGDYAKATAHYESLIAIGIAQAKPSLELRGRCGLTYLMSQQRAYRQTIRQLEQVLPLAQGLEEWAVVAELWQRLAVAYSYSGRPRRGLHYLEASLALSQTHHLKAQEIDTLKTFPQIYEWMGQPTQALPYLNRCLKIYQAQRNLSGQGEVLRRLGRHYFSIGDHEAALTCNQESLAIHQSLYAQPQEELNLADLGTILAYGLGQFAEALLYLEQAQTLAVQLDDRPCLALVAAHQAYCYAALGQETQANQAIQTSFVALQSLVEEEQSLAAIVYACLAKVHWEQGHYLKGLGLIGQYLRREPPWRTFNGRLLLAKTWETIRQTLLKKLRRSA